MSYLSDEIAQKCENLLQTINDTRERMDPDQQHMSFINIIEDAYRQLEACELQYYNLPDKSRYPLLYDYMHRKYKGSTLAPKTESDKLQDEIKECQGQLIRDKRELQRYETEFRLLPNAISNTQRNIAKLETKLQALNEKFLALPSNLHFQIQQCLQNLRLMEQQLFQSSHSTTPSLSLNP